MFDPPPSKQRLYNLWVLIGCLSSSVSNTTASTSSGSSDTGMSPTSASPTQNTVAVECRWWYAHQAPPTAPPHHHRLRPLRRPRANQWGALTAPGRDRWELTAPSMCGSTKRLRPPHLRTHFLFEQALLSGSRTFSSSFRGTASVSLFHSWPRVEGGVRRGRRSTNPNPSLHSLIYCSLHSKQTFSFFCSFNRTELLFWKDGR